MMRIFQYFKKKILQIIRFYSKVVGFFQFYFDIFRAKMEPFAHILDIVVLHCLVATFFIIFFKFFRWENKKEPLKRRFKQYYKKREWKN